MDPPEGIIPIKCKWVYKKKNGSIDKVETYKARLVVKGYSQKEGINYEESFSPIAMLKSIQILLVISAHFNYEILHINVKTIILNRRMLEKDIYMVQPYSFWSTKGIS